MKIVALSDTHGLHARLEITACDIAIHAGDVTSFGTEFELMDFATWFAKQKAKHKIFIAGNHDLCLDVHSSAAFTKKYKQLQVHYLCNSGIAIEGKYFWGSPVSPYFLGMAFNKQRGTEIAKIWAKIPTKTDVLITHTPPFGILDNKLGCKDLLAKIKKTAIKLHVFGHIHSAYGTYSENNTTFINASLANSIDYLQTDQHRISNKILEVEI